jgi:sugar-phosphatase
MIAAKAARMKCVVVPTYTQQKDEKWSIADLKISSLKNFSELHINLL